MISSADRIHYDLQIVVVEHVFVALRIIERNRQEFFVLSSSS